jgi:hypothetical protein
MPALGETIGTILDDYATVIEGGFSSAGTEYKGIPGNYSNHPDIRNGNDTPMTTIAAGDTTSVMVASSYTYDNNRWAKDETPPWFVYCSVYGGVATPSPATKVGSGSTIVLKEGFKRLPNHVDIEDEGPSIANGYDRFFQLTALPGKRDTFFGDGYHTYRTKMELRLRILKYARARDAIASVLENMMIIRSIITRGYNPNHRPNYVRALLAQDTEPKIEKQDLQKVIAVDEFDLIYSVSAAYEGS